MSSNLKSDAVELFGNDPVMKKVCSLLAKSYYKFDGEFRGTIKYSDLPEDWDKLTRLISFMGLDKFDWNKKDRFLVRKFVSSYQDSKFQSIPLAEVIVAVTGKTLETKSAVKKEKEKDWEKFLEQIRKLAPSMLNLSESQLNSCFRKSISDQQLKLVQKAMDSLPDKITKIPVFAYQISGDPHCLDKISLVGQIFYQVIETMVDSEENLFPAEQEQNIYRQVNLIKDDVSNNVTVNNLFADSDKMWQDASYEHTVWSVPLKTILEVKNIYPSFGNKIFVIENSGIYSILTDLLPEAPLVCSNGQFSFAVLQLLERVKDGVKIYYASDFDPAGLNMTQRLLKRWPNKIKLLNMSVEDYLSSDPQKKIESNSQLSILNNIDSPELLGLRDAILEKQLAGYQEGIINRIVESIRMNL